MKRKDTPAARAFRKTKSESINAHKKRAWKVFSAWVRKRDKGICYTCGKDMSGSRAYHAGHFISRRVNNTLFDEENVRGQCMFCNMYNYGASGKFAKHLIEEMGLEKFQDLLARGEQEKQFTHQELDEIIQKYAAP